MPLVGALISVIQLWPLMKTIDNETNSGVHHRASLTRFALGRNISHFALPGVTHDFTGRNPAKDDVSLPTREIRPSHVLLDLLNLAGCYAISVQLPHLELYQEALAVLSVKSGLNFLEKNVISFSQMED